MLHVPMIKLYAAYARERLPGEGFGDFTVREGHVAPPPAVERAASSAPGA